VNEGICELLRITMAEEYVSWCGSQWPNQMYVSAKFQELREVQKCSLCQAKVTLWKYGLHEAVGGQMSSRGDEHLC
jgi:hypothetical protein